MLLKSTNLEVNGVDERAHVLLFIPPAEHLHSLYTWIYAEFEHLDSFRWKFKLRIQSRIIDMID